MGQYPRTLNKIIGASGLNLNQLSQACGISNPYLAKLVKGRIHRPGKDKICAIMIGLNHSIAEIDEVLAEYDYSSLQKEDIPAILQNNSARRITGGSLSQFDHIYFDLLVLVLENIGGTRILVKNRPSCVFMPHKLYLEEEYPYRNQEEHINFRFELTRAILKERSTQFLENCRKGCRTETFICTDCLTEYLETQLGGALEAEFPGRRILVSRYFANALSIILKRPDEHQIYLMERCPYFHFLLQDVDGRAPKVSYLGKKIHRFENRYDSRILEGFTTDLPQVVGNFEQEVELCRSAVPKEMRTQQPQAVKAAIVSLFSRFDIERQLEEDLDQLMGYDDLVFY